MNSLVLLKRVTLICITCCFFSACCMSPRPFENQQLYQKAQVEIQQMFDQQPAVCDEIDFKQAMARGLKYNLDNRVKQANIAIKANQMKLAEFAMFPELGLSGSYYNRSNENATYGSDENGNRTDQIAFGADKTIRSARAAVKWNLIDLGLGYVKAREEGDRLLIAEEESRQLLQKLVQDIKVAYWSAYNAQQMAIELQEFHAVLQNTKKTLTRALNDKVIPKDEILNYKTSLLEGNRRLLQLEDKLEKAQQFFKFLINVPVDQALILKEPPISITEIQNLRGLDFEKLDAITLVNRPELRGQGYQQRIAEFGTKAAILQALPAITLNDGRNYNSNSFLVHNFWTDRSIEASWNIVNLAALPVSLNVAKTKIKFESLKLMAITLGALNESRIAFAHYQNLAKESQVACEQVKTTSKMYKLLHARERSNLGSKNQVVLAKLRMLFAKMDEILLLADLSTALGQLYIASGFDFLPLEATSATQDEVLCMIENNLLMQESLGFKNYVDVTYENLFCENKITTEQ